MGALPAGRLDDGIPAANILPGQVFKPLALTGGCRDRPPPVAN